MNKIDKLVTIYNNWGTTNNLTLGSADEEIFERVGLENPSEKILYELNWLERFQRVWWKAEEQDEKTYVEPYGNTGSDVDYFHSKAKTMR